MSYFGQEKILDSLQSCKYNYLLRNDTILLIEAFDKVLRYDYLNYMSLSILWITWLYVLIIFTCIEIICEMKDDDYENQRMTLR